MKKIESFFYCSSGKLSFDTVLTHERIFLGIIASFWVTYISSGFVTRISDRNPGKFLEKGAKNHICVDCCFPMDFSENTCKEKRKWIQFWEIKKIIILASILCEIQNFEETCFFFRFLPENLYFSKNHLALCGWCGGYY